ncbi:hypothetical protein Q2941_21985 [Bradyrhizobium sp. UFLA05-153]
MPIQTCRDYVERLKKAGADVVLTDYPGATYASFVLKQPQKVPAAQTARNCLLAEGEGGQILNSKSGAPFTLNDPCLEKE